MAIVFLIMIAGSLVGAWLVWDPWYRFNEKRRLAAFPDWPRTSAQAADFLPGVLSFYRDHFGFRRSLIHGLKLTEVGLLHDSGDSNVIIGDNGWLYLRLNDGSGSSEFSKLAPLSESELNRWQYLLEQRRAWLAKRHISYLVVIVPEKQSIYPEFLPTLMKSLQFNQWADQLAGRLTSTGSPVTILDLRPYLLQAKSREPVYWKADTHWNQYGVYVGYQAIMNEILRILPNRPLIILGPDNFARFPANGVGGDLANLLGVPELFNERFNAMTLGDQRLPPRGAEDSLYEANGDPRMPRLVMYHDSFGSELIPLMARSFSRGAYYWGKHDMRADFIATEQPDLVIDEFAERFLTGNRWEIPEISEGSNPK
jgi:alginate O-acetyltransferase complex protein AlgJ